MSTIAEQALGALLSGAKGAAAGSALGPVGSVAGGVIGVAMDLLPSAAHWLGADEETAARVVQTVQTATGATTAPEQRAALAADPGMADDLKVQLAQIAADRAAEDNRALEARLTATLGDVANARQQTTQLAQMGSKFAWGAPIVSVIVLAAFAVMTWVVISHSIPAGSEQIALVMLGTLGTLATAVVSFWVGSSAGSSEKSSIIANLAQTTIPASMMPKPAAVVPAADVEVK